jgi:TolB-like protein
LPFRNDSPDTTNTYFINGIMEEVLNDLQRIKDLKVISRTSVEQFRNTSKSIPEIAKILGVNYIVEGSGQKYTSSYRLRVQLVEAKTDKHLWADSYEKEIKEVKDIYSVQSLIAQSIADELKAVITPQVKQLIENPPTENLEAYRLYMLGNNFMFNMFSEDSYRKAIDYYHRAIESDSSFALAYAGLASAFFELSSWDVPIPSSEFITQAWDWALKALEISKNSAEAYFVIGAIKYEHEWDWKGAEEEFKKGMELNPNYIWGRLYYANYLSFTGRFKESIAIGQQTLKLSPLEPAVYNELALPVFLNGQDKEAIELTKKCLDLNPSFDQTLFLLLQFYAWKGLYDQAVASWRKIMESYNNDLCKIPAFYLACVGQAFGVNGHREEVIPLLSEINRRVDNGDYVANTCFGLLYRALGETDKAIDFFEKGLNKKESAMILINVLYKDDSIRSNKRFKELLRKMGFN